jgi:hypothetical protein
VAGLYKLIALFVIGAAGLAYANDVDVANRYPAIDTMFWFCVFGAGSLSIRALVELVPVGSMRGDRDEGGATG